MHISKERIPYLISSLYAFFVLKPTITPSPPSPFERLAACIDFIPRFPYCSRDGAEWTHYQKCVAEAGLRVEDPICVIEGVLQLSTMECEKHTIMGTGGKAVVASDTAEKFLPDDGLKVVEKRCFANGTFGDLEEVQPTPKTKQPILASLRDFFKSGSATLPTGPLPSNPATTSMMEMFNLSLSIHSMYGLDIITAWQVQQYRGQTRIMSMRAKANSLGDYVVESCLSGRRMRIMSRKRGREHDAHG